MEELFTELYDKYHRDLYQFLFYLIKNKEQAEDLVQEVYIKAIQSYGSFKGESSEKTWLISIARHTAIDWFRKQKRMKRGWLDLTDWKDQTLEWRDPQPLPEEIAEAHEDVQELYHFLQKCSINQQLVLVLRYIQGYSIKETAEILGWSESKVKTTQHRGVQALKDYMNATNVQKEGSNREKIRV